MSDSSSRSKTDTTVTITVTVIGAVIAGVCGCVAATIGLGQPIVSKMVDVYFPAGTSLAVAPSPTQPRPAPPGSTASVTMPRLPTSAPALSPTAAGPVGTPAPTSELQTFTGQGTQVSPRFTLSTGLALFRVKLIGDTSTSWFRAELLDSAGRKVFTAASGMSNIEGMRGTFIKQAGTYMMNVDAKTGWTISVEQPQTLTAPEPPQTFTRGQPAFPMIRLSAGLATFHIENKGSKDCFVGGSFELQLYNSNGEHAEQVVIAPAGPFSGSKAMNIEEAGVYLLNITACSDDWSVTVEQ